MPDSQRYIFKEGLSEKIKSVFLEDALVKYNKLKDILKTNSFEEKREVISRIAHGYKANAGYVGQDYLFNLVTNLDSSFKSGESSELLIKQTEELLDTLAQIIKANR